MKNKKILVLDNIRSVLNVGAIFRTADAIEISEIYLIGITPCPVDRFGRHRMDLHKSALGAEKNLKWKYFKNSQEAILELEKNKAKIISVEQNPKSVDYKKFNQDFLDHNLAIVIGNEVEGVSLDFLKASDQILEIKMLGKKESLNVSVATGIVLFRIFDR